jgi:hypothetical protein
MAFKNLEQRFNETVNDLYAGAKLKFDGGRASTGANDDPLITRRPGDGYFGGIDRFGGRSTPVSSTIQDVKRLTLFTVSTRGVAFLAKQQLLQTGNTFEQTRLINPAFVIGNAVPFLHIRRHLRPITGEFGITASRDSIRVNARKLGQLQSGTFESSIAKYNLNRSGKTPGIGQRLGAALKSIAGPFTSTFSAITAKRDIGEEGGRNTVPSVLPLQFGKNVPEDPGWAKSRPEMDTVVKEAENSSAEYIFRSAKELGDAELTSFRFPGSIVPVQVPEGISIPYIKYFIPGKDSDEATAKGKEKFLGIGTDNSFEYTRDINELRNTGRKISYIRDPLNEPANPESGDLLEFYKDLKTVNDDGSEGEDDPIVVSFAMGNDSHVQFRAFIRDINQNATPDYNVHQYIGRIEKFITYSSVQREVGFSLDLVAFSKDELDIVWKRLNYLTAFVFPYGFTRGILQPNIIRFTIGNMFKDQPGYVTSFDVNFTETSESWDIDREVPIAATVNMRLVIIEKDTKTANKPFYGILE